MGGTVSHRGFVSMNCACGISTILALSSVRITLVGLVRSCQAGTSTSLSVYCHSGIPNRLDSWGLPLRRDRDFDGLVDELQLLGFQALSEPSASPSHNDWYVCHSCCSRASSFESPQCSVQLLWRCCCEELDIVVDLVYIVARVSLRHLRLASSTLPAVGSDLSPAVGPLFPAVVALFSGSALFTRSPIASSEPRSCITLFWTSIMHRVVPDLLSRIIQSHGSHGHVHGVCWLHAITRRRRRRCCCGCLTFSSVCLSGCHALRDVIMALHELFGCELFACVQHAHSRAARGLLD